MGLQYRTYVTLVTSRVLDSSCIFGNIVDLKKVFGKYQFYRKFLRHLASATLYSTLYMCTDAVHMWISDEVTAGITLITAVDRH